MITCVPLVTSTTLNLKINFMNDTLLPFKKNTCGAISDPTPIL